MNTVDYLERLVWEYTQLCQRPDGSVYGIASGKQCKKGTPISYNPNLAKQVREREKAKIATIIGKAKAIGLTNRDVKDISEEVKSELGIKNLQGRDALKLFAKKANQVSKAKGKGNQNSDPSSPRPRTKDIIRNNREDALESSPKYGETPGSREPIKGKSYKDFVEIANELLKDPYYQRDSLVRAFAEGDSKNVPLAVLYREQGFNNRPELVPSVKDLKARGDLMKKDNGENIIFYRGADDDSTNQFLGIGERGNIHRAGRGNYGNGTYAAASNKGWGGEDAEARGTAEMYAPGESEQKKKQIVSFGLRADANIVDLDSQEDFWDWQDNIILQARQATGLDIQDYGHAAAALGIHAYKIKGGNRRSEQQDYWVILNRGAVVASTEEYELL
jgi:hypothetical protein